jgi:hypothetical protein
MFHLFNSVYLNFDFNFEPAGKDFILASDIYGNKPMITVQNNEVYQSQPSFEDLIKYSFTGEEDFWAKLIARNKKVVVYVKPSQFYKLQTKYLKSVFKHASVQDLHKIHVSFIESTRLRSYIVDCTGRDLRRHKILTSINALSLEEFEELYNSTEVSKVLQSLDKSKLSFEYLLADYIYNKNSKYKYALLDKSEVIIWDNWFNELEYLRYEILFGSLDLNKLDPNIELGIGTIEDALAQSELLKWTVDADFAYNREYIKTNYDYETFNSLWDKIYSLSGISSDMPDMSETNELINKNMYEELLTRDINRGFGCTYTGEMFREKCNHVFATYCCNIARSNDTSSLAPYRLDDSTTS